MTPTKPQAPKLTAKVERGLQTLSQAAGGRLDPDGEVASARRWLAARLAWRALEREKPDPPTLGPKPHQETIDALVDAWEQEHERKYPFGSRDAAVVRRLRQLDDFTLETCLARWGALLLDPWWRSRGIAIPDLEAQWSRLASKVASNTGQASSATSAAARLARKLKGSR